MTTSRPLVLTLVAVAAVSAGWLWDRPDQGAVAAARPIAGPPPAFVDMRRRLLDQDAVLLRAQARADLRRELDDVFDRLDARVPAMTDWAFRWRTSFSLLAVEIEAAARYALDDDPRPLYQAVAAAGRRVVEDAFHRLMLEPAETEALLERARLRWDSRTGRALAEVVGDHRLAVGLHPTPAPERVPPAETRLAGEDVPDPAVGSLQTRVGRPLLSRVLVRSTGLVPGATVAEAAGLVTGSLIVGSGAGIAVGIGAVLGFDYAANRLDAGFNEDGFSASLRAALAEMRAGIERQWLSAADAEIDRHIGMVDDRLSRLLSAGFDGTTSR